MSKAAIATIGNTREGEDGRAGGRAGQAFQGLTLTSVVHQGSPGHWWSAGFDDET